ncbi:MAG: hypothetical protein IH598_04035 [Bacteroidales bacterium]|nr:hypothetical protein [Bacteroidales bacterium]
MEINSKAEIVRFGKMAVYLNMFGIIFSGLVFPVLSMIISPQPPWKDAELFIRSFHTLQTATFFLGYFLVMGSLLTFVTLALLTEQGKRIWALSGLAINVVFTAIVILNYIIQTTYVPYLATNNPPETSFLLPAFSMANPGSFAWALEMYGWGGVGLSFMFMACIFEKEKWEPQLKRLFLLNGLLSIAGALITSVNMNWLFTNAGLISLVVWNVLVFVIDIVLLKYFAFLQTKATQIT